MRGRNAAASSAAAKKASSASPAPSKPSDRTVRSGGQKGHGSIDKVKAGPCAEELAKCEDCGVVITGDVAALQCDSCENPEAWKCIKCLGMSADLYHELINNRDLKWFCRECHTRTTGLSSVQNTGNDNMEKILDKVNHLIEFFTDWEPRMIDRVRTEVVAQLGTETQRWKDDIGQLDKKVRECEQLVDGCRIEAYSKIAECETKIAELLERTKHLDSTNVVVSRADRWDLEEDNWPHLNGARPCNIVDQGQVKEIIVKAVNQQQEEDKEIEARRNNLVLYNIPECQSEKHDIRLKADRDFIKTMCDDVAGIQITDSDILKCVRLGAFTTDKIRPILITLVDGSTKENVLRMGKDLGLSGNRYNKIGIANDYTPLQRDEHRKLLAEAKADILAQGDNPENYKLYVTRRNTKPQVIKKKRYKAPSQQVQSDIAINGENRPSATLDS